MIAVLIRVASLGLTEMVIYTKTGRGEGCLGTAFQAGEKTDGSVLGVFQKQKKPSLLGRVRGRKCSQ